MKIAEPWFMNVNQYVESMSKIRRSLLLLACVWFIFMIASGGRMPLTALLINRGYFFAIVILLLGCAMDAVLIVELLRTAFPNTRSWNDIKHFCLIIIVWLMLIPLSVYLLLLLTQPNLSGPPNALPDSNRNTGIYFIAQSHSRNFSPSCFI